MLSKWLAVVCLCLVPATVGAADLASTVDAAGLPKGKTTPLGLYLSAQDTHRAITANPDIVYVDVRDPVEIAFVGHAEGLDGIVPLNIVTHRYDAKRKGYKPRRNADFAAQIDALMEREGKTRDDPIVLSCRSGGRSAAAVKILAKAGYTNVYNQIEGFEGDWNRATNQRDRNGWRNAGLPWAYKLGPGVAWEK